jgi:hypothetical protein
VVAALAAEGGLAVVVPGEDNLPGPTHEASETLKTGKARAIKEAEKAKAAVTCNTNALSRFPTQSLPHAAL